MSGFKGTRNVNGRPKGALNKTTAETKELLQTVLGKEVEKLGSMLAKLDPLDRINAVTKLLILILPKSIEVKAEVTATTVEMSDEQRNARIEYLKNKLLE
ncbi:hypothetical protein H4V97_000275 [Flavobacterium sp. CG_23.5]|uniref:hypothetical protein n=1 Tax=Flavobacterium sp. CG_23.5 TaxID=2760708 RepID=UPI001AE3CE71|nr:hypothetical protein [Flavobacterium sp. CG_23.5]MBP2281957.1 hypothetical protein [Flavobacterium sp. CG_23.5]